MIKQNYSFGFCLTVLIFNTMLFGMEESSLKQLKFIEREILRYAIEKCGKTPIMDKINRSEPITVVLRLRSPKEKGPIIKILREAIDLKEKRIRIRNQKLASSYQVYQLLLNAQDNPDFCLPSDLIQVITLKANNVTGLSENNLGDYTMYEQEIDEIGSYIKCTSVFTDAEVLRNEMYHLEAIEENFNDLIDQKIAKDIGILKINLQ